LIKRLIFLKINSLLNIKEYDRNRKLADREYSTTNNEGHWDYRSSYRVDEILYDKKRPIEVSENLKRYNSNKY
jgi:hypothetical protein